MEVITNIVTADDDTVAILFNQLPLFQSLTKLQRMRLFACGEVREVVAEHTLVEDDWEESSLLVLLSGACQVRKTIPDRGLGQFKEVVLREDAAPAIFGEIAFLGQGNLEEIIYTTQPSCFWILTQTAAQQIFKESPKLGLQLMQAIGKAVSERARGYANALAAQYGPLQLPEVSYLNRNESPHVIDGVKDALVAEILGNNLSRYPDAYSENVLEKLALRLDLPQDWLMITSGSSIALDMTARGYARPGMKTTIISPTFEVFGFAVRNQQAEVIEYAYSDPYKPDLNEFLQSAASHSDIIYIANPNTPTGLYHTMAQLKELAEARPETLFVIDEAYYEFTGDVDGQGVVSLLRERPHQFIVVRTMSKAFSLAGLRIGYVIGQPERLAPIKKYLIPYSVNRLSQVAACAILSRPAELAAQVEKICRQREELVKGLRDLGYRVEAGPTNFMLLFVADAVQAIKYFRRHDILVRYVSSPAKANFLGECVRISIGDEDDTKRLLRAAKNLLTHSD
jgi:histidinol-phosphate aminotransferase